ncbi:MAG: ATP-dependent zinc protease [Acidimicrobiales bacterium]
MLGWREWVAFPDYGIAWLKAKIDTGARTSSVHATDVTVDGAAPPRRAGDRAARSGRASGADRRWVSFTLHPWQRSEADGVTVTAPLLDERWIRSSNGDEEYRPVVAMMVTVAGVTHEIEMTLTQRPHMGFRMLLGREAMRGRFLVDPGRSYAGGRAPADIRRRNRNRPPEPTRPWPHRQARSASGPPTEDPT